VIQAPPAACCKTSGGILVKRSSSPVLPCGAPAAMRSGASWRSALASCSMLAEPTAAPPSSMQEGQGRFGHPYGATIKGAVSYCLTRECSPKRDCCLTENVPVASCCCLAHSFVRPAPRALFRCNRGLECKRFVIFPLDSILLFDRAAGILPPRPQICPTTARSGGQ
jgi:hypothetical protein